MDIQRLRNLTTRVLHTEMGHVYQDLETIVGEKGLMTHMIPNMLRAVEPWLREKISDERFWNGKFDTEHTGKIELPNATQSERKMMIERYKSQKNPLELAKLKLASN